VKQTLIITTWPSLIVLHHITPSLPLHRLTAQLSGPANYTQRGSSTAPHRLFTVKTKGKAQKTHPTPHTMCHRHRPPHLTKTSHHTCKYKAVSYPSTPLPVSTHNPLFIRSIWFAEQTLSSREYRLTGPHCQKAENWHSSLLHHRTLGTRHPLPPPRTLALHQIIYDYLILYTYIYCQDARDIDSIVFCFGFWFFGFWFFWFFVAYCTQLLSQVMYNLMMATTMAETCSC